MDPDSDPGLCAYVRAFWPNCCQILLHIFLFLFSCSLNIWKLHSIPDLGYNLLLEFEQNQNGSRTSHLFNPT